MLHLMKYIDYSIYLTRVIMYSYALMRCKSSVPLYFIRCSIDHIDAIKDAKVEANSRNVRMKKTRVGDVEICD